MPGLERRGTRPSAPRDRQVSILLLALAIGLSSGAGVRQTSPREIERAQWGSLRSAREVFAAADRGANGVLGLQEAEQASIPAADFAGFDFDRDRVLSFDEFLVYYARLLANAGRAVDEDLAREVSRVRARRRVLGQVGDRGSATIGGATSVEAQLERARVALEAASEGRGARSTAQRGSTLRPSEASARKSLTTAELLHVAQVALEGRERTQVGQARAQRAAIEPERVADLVERARRALDRRRIP